MNVANTCCLPYHNYNFFSLLNFTYTGKWDGITKEGVLSDTEGDQVFKAPARTEKVDALSEPKPSGDPCQHLSPEEDVISAEEIIKLSSGKSDLCHFS